MKKVKFHISKPKGVSHFKIRLQFCYNGHRLRVWMPFNIESENQWNRKTQRVRKKAGFFQAMKINEHLDYVEQKIINAYMDSLKSGSIPNPSELLNLLNLSAKKQSIGIIEIAKESMKIKARSVEKTTMKRYKTALNHLISYEKEFGRIAAKDISMLFYHSFVEYLYSKDMVDNSVGSIISGIKVFCKHAEDVHNIITPYSKFYKPSSDADSVYLSLDELKKIYNTNLPEILDKYRDMFLIACYTGVRFSDWREISTENIRTTKEGDIFNFKTKKTGQAVAIPVFPEVRRIMNKYPGGKPPIISNQKFNEYIKEVCKLSGITSDFKKTRSSGATKTTEVYKKWELVSAHTARRTFATNLFLIGVDVNIIRLILGHKTEKTTLKYLKLSKTDNALLLMNHPSINDKFRLDK